MSKIINISEAASIAIHSTVAIAKSKNKLNANELAKMINVSKNHLSAVMQVLTKNGLIASERGPKGGFFLKKNAFEISLLDLYKLIDGTIEDYNCMGNCSSCPFNKCIFGGLAGKFTTEFKDYLSKTKVSDLIS